MALRGKVLQKKAEKFELKESYKININSERISALGELLDDAYLIHRPKLEDYEQRRALVQVFNEIAKELYGKSGDCPIVEEFGSFSMDLFSTRSDLDLSVNFSHNAAEFPRDKKIKTLRKFAKKFYALQSEGHVFGIQPIMTAKVPILKVIDRGTGIECDLSVENRDGILKSRIVHLISSIDERFHKLSCLMKSWAKAHNINSSKDHTLNSLSITLLVAFHLQTRNPPILPPFSAILKDGTDLEMVKRLVNNYRNYGRSNTESLAELFVSLLLKLASIEKLWPKGLCASTYEGSWISKEWDSKVAVMSVEDFTDRSQNVARAVAKMQVEEIYKCIQLSIRLVSAFMDGRTEGPRLRDSLFGTVDVIVANPHVVVVPVKASPLIPAAAGGQGGAQKTMTSNPTVSMTKRTQPVQGWEGLPAKSWGAMAQVTPFEHNLSKKIRVNDGWGGTPAGSSGGSATQGWGAAGSWKGPATEGWGGIPRDRWEGPVTTLGWGGAQKVDWTYQPPIWKSQEMRPTNGSWNGTREVNWAYNAEMQSAQNGWGGKPTGSWGAKMREVDWSHEVPLARSQEIEQADGWGRRHHQLPSHGIRDAVLPTHFPQHIRPGFDGFRRVV